MPVFCIAKYNKAKNNYTSYAFKEYVNYSQGSDLTRCSVAHESTHNCFQAVFPSLTLVPEVFSSVSHGFNSTGGASFYNNKTREQSIS